MENFNREHFERIIAMSDDTGSDTWDFSENDLAALQWVCRRLDSLTNQVRILEDAAALTQPVNTGPSAEAVKAKEWLANPFCYEVHPALVTEHAKNALAYICALKASAHLAAGSGVDETSINEKTDV